MKRKTFFVRSLLIIAVVFANKAAAQDIHFSQFYQSTILNNPALTGIFNEDYKVGFVYRTQWNTLATPFVTTLIDLETKVHLNGNDYISFGLLAYFDKAGAIDFNTNGFYPAVNYNKSLEDQYNSYLSFGITGGNISRSVDLSKMTFDNQYVGGIYVPTAPTGEQLTNNKISYWDVGAGVTYNSSFDPDNRINYYVGAAGYHLSQPKTSFSGQSGVTLPMRIDGNLGLNYEMDEEFGFMVYGNIMIQHPYQEIIAGGLFRWTKPNHTNSPPFSISMGAFYRLQDAWIPTVKLAYKKNFISLSYDVTSSSLKEAVTSHGAFEISVFISSMWNGAYDDKHSCPRF